MMNITLYFVLMIIKVTFLFVSFEIGGLVGRIEFWNKISNKKKCIGYDYCR